MLSESLRPLSRLPLPKRQRFYSFGFTSLGQGLEAGGDALSRFEVRSPSRLRNLACHAGPTDLLLFTARDLTFSELQRRSSPGGMYEEGLFLDVTPPTRKQVRPPTRRAGRFSLHCLRCAPGCLA